MVNPSSSYSESDGPISPTDPVEADLEVISSVDDDNHSPDPVTHVDTATPVTPVTPVSPSPPQNSALGDDGLMVDDTVLSTMELPESKTATGTRQSKRQRTRKRKLVDTDFDYDTTESY